MEELKRSDKLVRLQIVRTPTINERAVESFRYFKPKTEITLNKPLTPRGRKVEPD